MKKIIVVLIVLIVVLMVGFLVNRIVNTPPSISPSATPATSPAITPSVSPVAIGLADPIADFKARITKKTFGMHITPATSPVQPEKFTGYHTGIDVEYTDVTADVPVYALADDTIAYSGWVSGYGGALIIKADIKGATHSVLYGHLRPASLPAVGTKFKKGDQMAVLGTGYSHETDGERRHLHFSVLSNDRIDLKGYVSNKSDLSGWLDPLSLY
jgi:murein DD-endopeptidase MepM/ murein hydrolase activator NlpD